MNFLLVDFEFTVKQQYGSPRSWFPEIIEVGAVLADQTGQLFGERYSAFIKPLKYPRITEECYAITGIHQKDIDNGINLADALAHLKDLTSGTLVWLTAWGASDWKTLRTNCDSYGIECPFTKDMYIDLATSYKTLYKLNNRASLSRAVDERGVDKVGYAHTALDDAINAALVLEKMIADGWIPVENTLSLGAK